MPESELRFERCVYIGVPAQTLWAALIDPQIVSRYYLTPLKGIDLQQGGRIAYGPPDQDLIEGRVLELEPEVKLVHSFRFAFSPGAAYSRVTFNVERIGEDLSCLYIVHDDFGDDTATYDDIRIGWDKILSSLKTLLETGHPLKWPDA